MHIGSARDARDSRNPLGCAFNGLPREASDTRNPLGCAFNGLPREASDTRNLSYSWSEASFPKGNTLLKRHNYSS